MKILLADDQALFCDSLKFLLEQEKTIEVVGCVNNGREAFESCKKTEPDLVLMDIMMPECDGVEGTRLIKTNYPKIKVLILTTFNDQPNLAAALANGADGYILKEISAQDLLFAVKNTAHGFGVIHKKLYGNIVSQFQVNGSTPKISESIALSKRELQIIRLVTEGKENREIAKSLYLGEGRIKNIITGILKKLQVKDRTQLAVYAVKNNLV
jgi:DNA-binding NarL/FixJ family response regulator